MTKGNDPARLGPDDVDGDNGEPELTSGIELSDKMIRHIMMTFILGLDREWSGGLDEVMEWELRICAFVIGVSQREMADEEGNEFKEMMDE